MTVKVAGETREVIDIVAGQAVPRLTVGGIFKSLLEEFFLAK